MTFRDQDYRVFGYSNPDPSNVDSDEIYGYEVCITISDELYDSLEDAPEKTAVLSCGDDYIA